MITQEIPVQLPDQLDYTTGKPLFLHFLQLNAFTRQRLEQFEAIRAENGEKMHCLLVVEPEDLSALRKNLHLSASLESAVVIDHDDEIARACGVYSSEAVVIDQFGYLIFRGNYHSRTNDLSPQAAIEAVLREELVY